MSQDLMLAGIVNTRKTDGATREQMRGQRHFTGDDFIRFVEAYFLDQGKSVGKPEPFRFTKWQKRAWRRFLQVDKHGVLLATTLMQNYPRRFSKSQLFAYYDLARALRYPNQLIVIQANSEDQAAETAFRWITNTIKWSLCFGSIPSSRHGQIANFCPAAGDPLGIDDIVTIEVSKTSVTFSNGSVIMVQPFSEATTYGKKISVYHNTELCKTTNETVFDAGASSTGDAWCGVTLIDSNMGDEENRVCKLTRAAQEAVETKGKRGDPSTVCEYVTFDTVDECIASGMAPWLERAWLISRQIQMAPHEFRRNHLNKPTGAGDPAFSEVLVRRAFGFTEQPESMEHRDALDAIRQLLSPRTSQPNFNALEKLFAGHSIQVGVGLDRSMGTRNSDNTVLSVVGCGVLPALVDQKIPIFDERGEVAGHFPAEPRVFFPLWTEVIPFGADQIIKDRMYELCDDGFYGIAFSTCFEAYQAKDLATWAENEGFDKVSVLHITDVTRANQVAFFNKLLVTGRFVGPRQWYGEAALLHAETLRYSELSGEGRFPKYGAKPGWLNLPREEDGDPVRTRVKDDALEAVFAALHPLQSASEEDDFSL